MIRKILPLVLASALAICPAAADHYQVYLLGGQSNGNGRADAAQLTPPLNAAQSDVRFYWHRTQAADNVGHLVEDQWIDLAPGSGHGTGEPVYAKEFGPEVSFGRGMADANPSANIAVIKYTHGGTTLANNWSASGSQYASFVSTVQAGLEALTSAGHTYELRGMLWAQGETDTNSGASADSYEANLTSFIARVRTDLFAGGALPFVLSTLSDNQYTDITTPGSGAYKVRQAQEAVAAADPKTGIVNTDGYSVRSDIIHFDHTAMVSLGQAFAAEMRALQSPGADSCGSRPNVIFILSDDQSWYDYSFMRRADVEKAALDANPAIQQVAKTPSIDRLVEEGLTFTHGYTTPLCRPSLAAMLTGTYPHQNWITGNDLENRPPDQALEARMQAFHPLPRTLESRLGYTSFQTGKWWEGHFSNGGFTAGDTVNSTAGGTAPPQWSGGRPSYVTARHGDWGLMIGRVDYVNDIADPPHPIPYANTMQPLTDFIDTQKTNNQPFFIWYAPFLPHTPHDPPSGLLTEYTALGLNNTDASYYANVERFDGGVGAILDHLDTTGLADNTIVVMICDNGRDMAFGKRTPYDGGVRTPIIVRWPDRIKAGGAIEPQIVTTPVSLVDMVPTIHHALGLPVFPEMTGVDLLDPAAVAARDTVFGEDNDLEVLELSDPSASLEARFAIRDGWKLILYTNGSAELYHLYDTTTGAPVDPFESNNIAASNPALVATLSAAIVEWYDAPKGQQVTNSEAASFVVTGDDLLQTSLDATTPVTKTGDFTNVAGVTVTGEPALRNGIWDNDSNGRGDVGVSDGASVTYHFDLAASPLGYTIDQIDLFSNWGPGQDRDEIRISIDYSVVASPTNFDNHIVIEESFDPPTLSQGKMSISNIGTSGVASIRFTWPATQETGTVGYAEIDVLGTADGSDTTPPHDSGFSPSDGALNAQTSGDLIVTFCEAIQAGTGFIRLFEADGTPVESFDVASSAPVVVDGTRITMDPSSDLIGGNAYYVQIDPTAIEDLSRNTFAGINDTISWNFTADGTAPILVASIPANGATNVLPSSSLTLTFNEPVQISPGNISIHLSSDNSAVQTINMPSGFVTATGENVTVDLPVNLLLDTAYYVNISAGAIADFSGNVWPGISGTTSWTFQTAATTAIHHWEFEGDATDSIGSHDGSLAGNAGFAAGRIGQAANLDGDGDSILINQSSLPPTNFTLTAWVNPNSTSDFNYIAGTQSSANGGAFLRVDDGVAFVNLLPPADLKRASGGTVPLSTWTHLAVTVDSTNGLTIYVNGSPVASDPAGTGHTTESNFRIGARPDGETFGFNGLIDDVRIYDSVLSLIELAELAGNGGGGDTTEPEASSLSPADNATAVAVNSNLIVTFNESVQKGIGNIVIKTSGGATVETIPIESDNVSVIGNLMTINPVADLAFESAYYINIDSGVIEDLAGNAYAGIGDATSWNFTTEALANSVSLIHHWKLDGDATDSGTPGGHNGTAQGNAAFTTGGGKFGDAISLDGIADFISTGASSLPATDFTMTAWVKPDSTTGFNYVAGTQSSGNFGAFLRIDDGLAFVNLLPPAASKRASGGTIPLSVWSHLAVKVSSTAGLEIFANGISVATDPAGTGHTTFNNFTIGARPDIPANNGFTGLIDDVAVFDGLLSTTQLSNVIALGAGNFTGAGNDFSSWIANPSFGLSPADQGFSLDPDGDLLENGIEAWFGTHPGERNSGIVGLSTDGITTTFEHPQNENPPGDLTGIYEWSPDLAAWYAGDGVDGPVGGATVTLNHNTVGPMTTVTATASAQTERIFLRIKVIQSLP